MIELPTRRKLERRRDRLYAYLVSCLHNANVIQVEVFMRKINIINLKLRTYFNGERQQKEIFTEDKEDDITSQDTDTGEVNPTKEELAQIEQQIQAGEI